MTILDKKEINMDLKCDVCKKEAEGVYASPLIPMSFAYCKECMDAGRLLYAELICRISNCCPCNSEKEIETFLEEDKYIKPYVDPTLKFYEKNKKDLFNDVFNHIKLADRINEERLNQGKERLDY